MKIFAKVFNRTSVLQFKISFIGLGLFTAVVAVASSCNNPSDESEINYVVVASEEGRYFGWPANNGHWNWDDGKEILVGCTDGPHDEEGGFHSIGEPQLTKLARSLDGGKTWTSEDPANFVGKDGEPEPSPGDINFGHPDFALRVSVSGYHGNDDTIGRFFISYDRRRPGKVLIL